MHLRDQKAERNCERIAADDGKRSRKPQDVGAALIVAPALALEHLEHRYVRGIERIALDSLEVHRLEIRRWRSAARLAVSAIFPTFGMDSF
jgi:hypothetical protein